MFRQPQVLCSFGTLAVALTALPAVANPVAGVRVTNAATGFDLVYAVSASTLGGYVASDNAPLATVPKQTGDTFSIASTSAKALAGELIYRAAGEPTRECTFRYSLAFTGGRFVLTADARASWTGQAACTVTTTGPDKTKGDFGVTFTMK